MSRHFHFLAELEQELNESDAVIVNHRYRFRTSGSWQIVIRKKHMCFRFTWDGSIRTLHVASGDCRTGSLSSVAWSDDEETTFALDDDVGVGDILKDLGAK